MGTALAPHPTKQRDKDRGTLGGNMDLLTGRLLISMRREPEQTIRWGAQELCLNCLTAYEISMRGYRTHCCHGRCLFPCTPGYKWKVPL